MPCFAYIDKKFTAKSLARIDQANGIIDEYTRAGYSLTLRQLYYQFVARGLIANKQTEYKNLGKLVSDGRKAGLIDWKAIEDRTRNLKINNHWDDPEDLLSWATDGFGIDKWQEQPQRVEVWIEKEALIGVIEKPARSLDVPFFACRGYPSDSEVWAASQRFLYLQRAEGVKGITIVHLGDHDPSGVDMTRDIEDRLRLFGAGNVTVNRIALNMPQVEEYSPPPNPAKMTDSRFGGYEAEFGDECWELDALDPPVIGTLITEAVEEVRDDSLWDEMVEKEAEYTEQLTAVRNKWNEVVEDLDDE